MILKGLVDEDFLQYRLPAMFLITSTCTFKCEKDAGCTGMCQNSSLVKAKSAHVADRRIVQRYTSNDITKAIVFGGLEPIDQFEELSKLIGAFRAVTDDTIVIYTGYKEDEISQQIEALKAYKNIIVKFGRYIPNQDSHLDPVLGVELASPNQYAKQIS